MNFFQGTWNMMEYETRNHSAAFLLKKLVAYRTSVASTSLSSSSSQNVRRSSILSESANFITRLWRSSTQNLMSSFTSSAAHEINSPSFDHMLETCSTPRDTSSIESSTVMSNHLMSFIQKIRFKSLSSNQTLLKTLSLPITPHSKPLFQEQLTTPNIVTDLSYEDITSKQQFDTNIEFSSQSLQTNINSNDSALVNAENSSLQQLLTFNEQYSKPNLTSESMKTSAERLSMRISKQQHHNSFSSSESVLDISMVSERIGFCN